MDDPIAMYPNDVLTVPASMAGLFSNLQSHLALSGTLPLVLWMSSANPLTRNGFPVGQHLEEAAQRERHAKRWRGVRQCHP